ncbi:MAG: F0F1 ATP synthase subunit B [Nitratireductor sp.]|nr:F0F1 ATP synthase subunit B [Nitratireductor sp.]MCC0020652.1 F0F1 ATP synthase subunit B [Nitratireductor sp.]
MFVTKAWAAETASGEAPAEATHSETGVAHGAEGGSFPPFDPTSFASQLLWLALTFGLFFLLMRNIVVPRISSILEVRRDRISRDLDEAQRLKEESDAAIAAYEQELTEARNAAHKIGQEARDKAKAEADASRHEVESELNAKIAESEKQVAAIKAKALGEVDTIAADTVQAIVSEILGVNTTKADAAKAVSSSAK